MIKFYVKKLLQPMRPYILGEDVSGISVNQEDTLQIGGMVAHNPDNPDDRWYVAKLYFEKNYLEVNPDEAGSNYESAKIIKNIDTKYSKALGNLAKR